REAGLIFLQGTVPLITANGTARNVGNDGGALMNEIELIAEADDRARRYLAKVDDLPAFPGQAALDGLAVFAEALPDHGRDAAETLRLLDEHGAPATTTSNGPRYFGFVIGAALPAASAAERLMLAWDQCASSHDN